MTNSRLRPRGAGRAAGDPAATDTQPLEPWTYLIDARLRAGYGTATEVAKALGLSVTHYCQVEIGRVGLSGPKLIEAARLFSVDVIELRNSRPDRPPRTKPAEAKAAA